MRRVSWLAWGFVAAAMMAKPAGAWNKPGHRVVAWIAYQNLTPMARDRVNSVLMKHPDYDSWTEMVDDDAPNHPDPELPQDIFMIAATFPDLIKEDSRFYNDEAAHPHAKPTPAGFPDSKQHRSWHFIDKFYTQDGSATVDPPQINGLERVGFLRGKLADQNTS